MKNGKLILLEFFDVNHVTDNRPGAGETPYEVFEEVREALVEFCRKHGRVGPEDGYDVSYWIVDDQYNDERYQYIEVNPQGMTKSWLMGLMDALSGFPQWGVGIGVPEDGYILAFSDHLLLKRGATFNGCNNIDEVVTRSATALTLHEKIRTCEGDRDVQLLSQMPEVQSRASLDLTLKQLTDQGVPYLNRFPRLKCLSLKESTVSDAGLAYLEPLPSLNDLWLQCPQIGDAGLENLPALGQLREIFLSGTRITDRALKSLAKFPNLETLELSNTGITNQGLRYLRPLTALKQIYFANTGIGDEGLAELRTLNGIELLYLDGTVVSDAGVSHLSSLSHLSQLSLSRTKITNRCLQLLRGISSLKEVTLFDTAVTREAVARLRKQWTNCRISSS